MNRRAQEEMVGFALIILIVAVILLVFLIFSLKEDAPEAVESYEIDNFVQSVLYYTLEDNVDIRDLIRECERYDENCDVLEEELEGILDVSWIVQEGGKIKGYSMRVEDDGKEIINLEKGNVTQNYKVRAQSDADLVFVVYY